MNMKSRVFKNFVFAVGIIAGIAVTLAAGFLFYKIRTEARSPKRFDARELINSANSFELSGGAKVFVASSLDRIFTDGQTLLRPTFKKTAQVSLSQNEYESFQIVVAAGEQGLNSVTWEYGDLLARDGQARLDKANITLRVVGYVPTIKPYYPVKYVGLWPDPLLEQQSVDIKPGVTQPLWVTVYVPAGTKPGTYNGTIILKAAGMAAQPVALELRVYDFALPREGRLKTAFDFYGHETRIRYPIRDKETEIAYQARIAALNEEFLFRMIQYRINPILNLDPSNNNELALVDRLRVLGLNNFSVGKRGGTLGNNWPKDDAGIDDLLMQYRTYGELLKLNRLLPYTYIYTWDEGEIGNPAVPKICAMIHKAYKELKNMVCYHGFWDPRQDPDWGKDIDIWCFQIDNFDEPAMRRLQEAGKEIWMYISGPGGYGSPNLAMDFDSIDYRIVPWLCWKYDIKGFLYWCVNRWLKVDPFKSANNTDWEQNGNGLLFYPGDEGPVASLRLELIRDGMEDYEYIQTLLNKLKIIRKEKLEGSQFKLFWDESIKLLTVDDNIAKSMVDFTRDNEALKSRRDAIARKIEEFNSLYSARPAAPETGPASAHD